MNIYHDDWLIKFRSSIDPKEAQEIIDEVNHAVSQWKTFAKEAGIGQSSTQIIQKYLKTIS